MTSKIRWFFGRLRVQFTIYVAALLLVLTGLMLAVNWRGQETIVLDRLTAHVQYVADLTADLAAERLDRGNVTEVARVIDDIVELENAMAIALREVDGAVLAEALGTAAPSDLLDMDDPGVADDHIGANADVIVDGELIAIVYVARWLGAGGMGILANAAFGDEVASSRAILQRSALTALALSLLAIPLAALLVRRATRGISVVTHAATNAASGNLSVEIPKTGTGEVVDLQDAFRGMQSALRHNIEEIESLAYVDSITGVANRTRFEQMLGAALIEGSLTGGAILMIDLDRFKGVNDTHGHQFGDAVLKAAAARIADIAKSAGIGDWTLARFSADVFALMLVGPVDSPTAEKFAGEILARLEKPFKVRGIQVNIGCSIGVSLVEKTTDAGALLQQADLALYSAKSEGRRAVRFYAAGVKAAAQRRAAIENDLREAIRVGALDVYYQPVLDTEAMSVIGAEALVRWKRPGGTFVEPSEFIPIAEESGLIGDIGKFVLKRGLTDFSRLHAEGRELSLAVNIAAAQIQREDFVETVAEALSEADFPPQSLELELTESTALLASSGPQSAIAQLRRLGVRFAIDDFGTGHSSLGRLPSLTFDTLKIDRSFVAELADNGDNQAIVRLIVSLAATLGLEIVAEGVEREEDHHILHGYGVQRVQGFLWCPALPLPEFTHLVQALSPALADTEKDERAAG